MDGGAELTTERSAVIDVRLLPWRPRTRRLDPAVLRRHAGSVFDGTADTLSGLLVGVAIWLTIIAAAPLIVLALAALLLPLEIGVALLLALAVVVIRVAGVVPWVVVVEDGTGRAGVERYRSLLQAIRRVRDVNGMRWARVRLSWA